MKRRYVICFDTLEADQSKSITSALKENGLGWWHWIDNVWFVTDMRDKFDAGTMRDLVKPFAPKTRLVVLELNEKRDTWAGVRADDPEQKMFTWFEETWNKAR